MSTALFWFRQDLRCQDNPALTLACRNHQKIILLYIKESHPAVPMGSAQQWWLHHSLLSLKHNLQKINLDLTVREGEPLTILKEIIAENGVSAVYWHRCYEPANSARDQQIKTDIKSLGINAVSCNGSLLNEPWDVLNQSGGYFKVFTPYWRQCLRQMNVRPVMNIANWPAHHPVASLQIKDLALLPCNPDWSENFGNFWQPGEQGALCRLDNFISTHLYGYKEHRNIPSIQGTSRLSPHLHFGEISTQTIWFAVQQAKENPGCDMESAECFLSELGWREFSRQLLYHYPNLPHTNFKRQFDRFPWQDNKAVLTKWQRGLTGYPIVDAGMRELWHTGYMHNRVRMIAASFLIKHLMIDWREGAAWFWDTLLDADLANNAASWQWVAGSGADAAPYYRIFNPVLQGEKFDPSGDYVKLWVPELASVPKKWLHKPWEAPGLLSGIDYPPPVVDHAAARKLALTSYQDISNVSRQEDL